MTNEEAIGNLTHAIRWNDMPKKEALDMAIKALKQEPCEDISEDGTLTVNVEDGNKVSRVLVCGDNHFGGLYYPEQEPCEDAISRQAVINAIANTCFWLSADNWTELMKCIDSLPPVTPQPKTGHWSRKTKVDAYDIAGVKTWGIKCQCDKCDFTTIVVEDFGYYKYCPNCGAKMEEVEE